MKEFFLLIRTEGDYCLEMTSEQHQQHLEKVGRYIQHLTQQGKLIRAQPLSLNGEMIQGKKGAFKDGPFVETKEIIIGYFHIFATDLEEAKDIAKANPVFEDTNARIEVREIKREEGIN
jgi:hypothetical protein